MHRFETVHRSACAGVTQGKLLDDIGRPGYQRIIEGTASSHVLTIQQPLLYITSVIGERIPSKEAVAEIDKISKIACQ